MAAIFRRAITVLQSRHIVQSKSRYVPVPRGPSPQLERLCMPSQEQHEKLFFQEGALLPSLATYEERKPWSPSFGAYALASAAGVCALQVYNWQHHPAWCMPSDRTPDEVLVETPPAEKVLDWEAGKNKPTSILSFAKEHFWKMVDVPESEGSRSQTSSGGNFVAKCKRCGKGPTVFTTTRMKAHVAGKPYSTSNQISACESPSPYWQDKFVKDFKVAENKKRQKSEGLSDRMADFQQGLSSAAGVSAEDGGMDSQWLANTGQTPSGTQLSRAQSCRSSGSAPPPKRTKNELRYVNEVLAKGCLSAGVPANVFDNPDFREALMMIAQFGPDFVPMGRKELYPFYAPRVRASLLEDMKKWLPNLETYGCTICSDGWKAIDKDHVLNGVSVNAVMVCFFYVLSLVFLFVFVN